LDIRRIPGVLVPASILFLSLTYVFFFILQFFRKQVVMYLESWRSRPKESSDVYLYIEQLKKNEL